MDTWEEALVEGFFRKHWSFWQDCVTGSALSKMLLDIEIKTASSLSLQLKFLVHYTGEIREKPRFVCGRLFLSGVMVSGHRKAVHFTPLPGYHTLALVATCQQVVRRRSLGVEYNWQVRL